MFWRAGAWCVLGAVPMLVGAAVHGHAREALWALAVAIEIGGAAIGFPTPGIGRSATREWTIDGRHFAERCQAFVLIALGESIVVSGGRLSGLLRAQRDTSRLVAFGAAFVAAVALWWVYFDRSAADSAQRSRGPTIPGRLGRNAFHWVHPIIVAGIIVTAAADEVVLANPTGTACCRRPGWSSAAWRCSWPATRSSKRSCGGSCRGHVSSPCSSCACLLVLAPHVTAIVLGRRDARRGYCGGGCRSGSARRARGRLGCSH